MITITKSGEVRSSIRFLQMLRRRFANPTRVLLCKSNREKLENMENITHLPYLNKIVKKSSWETGDWGARGTELAQKKKEMKFGRSALNPATAMIARCTLHLPISPHQKKSEDVIRCNNKPLQIHCDLISEYIIGFPAFLKLNLPKRKHFLFVPQAGAWMISAQN